MRSAFLVVAAVLAAGPALVACARGGGAAVPEPDTAWEARYAPAPGCRVGEGLDRSPEGPASDARTATLVVRLVSFDPSTTIDKGWILLAPLPPLDSAAQSPVRLEQSDPRLPRFVAPVVAGRYLLTSRAFGFEARSDTVVARAGRADTVTVALEAYADALRNRHNCRPRGFRRAGEPSCVTDQITAVVVLDRVRDMATPRFRFGLGLPPGDSTAVRLVDDERACERAARLYAVGPGPPRRVVLVQATNFYVAYDPAEPVPLGELNQWLVLDLKWRVLARLAL